MPAQTNPPNDQAPLPVAVVTGFLGSGKTTFLNWLLSRSNASRIAVIVNEFGEIGLDHLLIATPIENIMLIEGGCLCCEVRGDLVQTLEDLRKRRDRGDIQSFDQVVIETTGLSNPVPIVQTVLCDESIRDQYRLGNIITVVDAVNSQNQMRSHIEAIRQIAIADFLLISKQDLASPESLACLEDELTSLNPGASRWPTQRGAPQGISASALLAADKQNSREAFLSWITAGEDLLRKAVKDASGQSLWSGTSMKSASHRLESVGVESFSLRRAGEISATSMVIWLNLLSTLKGERLLRLKAILNVEGKPVAIHAAQTIVHEPIELTQWPDEDRDSRFVVISQGSIKAEFERSLGYLDFEMPAPSATPTIDPEAYRKFLQLTQAFTKPDSSTNKPLTKETP